jgi:hypothetical protein
MDEKPLDPPQADVTGEAWQANMDFYRQHSAAEAEAHRTVLPLPIGGGTRVVVDTRHDPEPPEAA